MIAIGAALYGGLSALCLAHAIPLPPDHLTLAVTLLAPPAILLWGLWSWPLFLGFTAALGACVFLAVRGRGLRRVVALFSAALIWALGGFFSYAISI